VLGLALPSGSAKLVTVPKPLIAFVDDIYEDLELWYPLLRLQEAGYAVRLAALEVRTYTGKHGYPAKSDLLLVDGNLISSRTPRDLALFAKAMVDFLAAHS
jgi:putative intracellular protease/amidase